MSSLPFLRTLGGIGLTPETLQAARSMKCLALLAVLSVSARPVHRRDVVDLLWDGSNERRGRSSLKQAIYILRQSLSHEVVIAEKDRISLNPSLIESDYTLFESAVARSDFKEAIGFYKGRFLDGHPYISDAFDDWRLSIASGLETKALAACEQQLSWAVSTGGSDEIAMIAALSLLINPMQPSVARARVIALASQGDAVGATRELEQARKRFIDEYGEVPPELDGSIDCEMAAEIRTEQHGFERRALPIVGRDSELASIRRQWDRAKDGLAVVVVLGEAGIGKSRIFHQVVRRVAIDGGRTFVHSCAEVELTLPYSAVAGLLRDGRRLVSQASLSQEDRSTLASIVPELFPGTSGVSHVSRLRVFEAVARLWQQIASSGSIVVAVDDFQWIDQGSQELLGYVQKRLAESPIMLLTAGRGRYSPVLFEDDHDRSHVCQLQPLSSDDCELLISSFEQLHDCKLDEKTRDLVMSKVGGRPLVLVEALHNLRLSGADSTRRDSDALVSPTLRAAVARRLQALTEQAQQLAAAAAVLNRDMPLFELAQIADMKTDNAAFAADEMVSHSFIVDARTIRFTHDLLRDVVFQRLSNPQRVLWHYRIAQHLVAVQSSRYAEIAFHYEEAGDIGSAYEYAKRSVEEAGRFYAYNDVDEAYARMLRCANPAQRETVSIELFRHWVNLGRLKDAYSLVDSVAAAFTARGDQEGLLLCEVVRYAGSMTDQGVKGDELEGAKGIIRLAEIHSPETLSTVLSQLADPIRRSGDYDLLRQFALSLVEYATDRSDDDHISADLLCAAALVGLMSLGFEFARPLVEAAVQAAQRCNRPGLMARALYARGTVCVCSGELDQANHDYDELLRRWEKELPEDVITRIKSNYSIVLMEKGLFEEAGVYGRMALREAGISRRSYAFGNLALIALRKGDTASASRYAKALVESYKTTGLAWVVPHGEAILGLVKLATGPVREAIDHAKAAERGLAAAEGIIDCSPIYELCGRVASLAGNRTHAIEYFEAGIDRLGHMDAIAASRLLVLKEAELCNMSAG